ncbi:hypothetical protein W822_02955 [Advenella kashmirensis W13003]|uniref:Uncharacterized protein n=1 Tax=Advenella kashmirensis W13003 TaxID=1424334 RepID=V8R0A3_9BURK|nr:hypothetical protein W822_02955 [Advenella kashmirensis W13003]
MITFMNIDETVDHQLARRPGFQIVGIHTAAGFAPTFEYPEMK